MSSTPTVHIPIHRPGTLIGGRYQVLQAPPRDPSTGLLPARDRDTGRFIDSRTRRPLASEPDHNPHLAGGMGIVYHCANLTAGGRHVALKTFQPQFLSRPRIRGRFLREAAVWLELGPLPYVVTAYEALYLGDGREVYLVLEWIAPEAGLPDANLGTWLRAHAPRDYRTALRLLLQLTWGMADAVARIPGLIHRDLKPGNLLIGADGRLCITDLGLAGMEAAMRAELAGDGAAVVAWLTDSGGGGTPGYMAPEQRDRGRVDGRADVYAFGVILNEVLDHEGGAAPPGEARALRKLAAGCRETNPERRPRDWNEVQLALKAACPWLGETGRLPAGQPDSRARRHAEMTSLNALGLGHRDVGEYPRAAELFTRGRTLARELGDRQGEASALGNLGNVYLGPIPKHLW